VIEIGKYHGETDQKTELGTRAATSTNNSTKKGKKTYKYHQISIHNSNPEVATYFLFLTG